MKLWGKAEDLRNIQACLDKLASERDQLGGSLVALLEAFGYVTAGCDVVGLVDKAEMAEAKAGTYAREVEALTAALQRERDILADIGAELAKAGLTCDPVEAVRRLALAAVGLRGLASTLEVAVGDELKRQARASHDRMNSRALDSLPAPAPARPVGETIVEGEAGIYKPRPKDVGALKDLMDEIGDRRASLTHARDLHGFDSWTQVFEAAKSGQNIAVALAYLLETLG